MSSWRGQSGDGRDGKFLEPSESRVAPSASPAVAIAPTRGIQAGSFHSRMALPAPVRLARRISEYLRERRTPGAPARRAAVTASFTLCGVDLLLGGSVGIS